MDFNDRELLKQVLVKCKYLKDNAEQKSTMSQLVRMMEAERAKNTVIKDQKYKSLQRDLKSDLGSLQA